MTYSKSLSFVLCTLLLNALLIGNALAAAEVKTLPTVTKDSKVSLMYALQERKSSRNFNDTQISPQVLGNLLWATWGINRADGKRIIPTALNSQEILIYVALEDGVWMYDPKNHTLTQKSKVDIRAKVGTGTAILIYAAPDNKFAPFHVGSLYQNAGLYSASINLGNVVRMTAVKQVNELVDLPKDYKVHITQAIGYTN